MNILQAGTQFLADQLLSSVASTVEYHRPDCEPMPLKATFGRTLFQVIDDGVQKVVWTDKDFIFKTADLDAAGIVEPESGDRIRHEVTIGSRTWEKYYLVSAPGGEQPYRNGDGHDVMTRVHTKLFSESQIV